MRESKRDTDVKNRLLDSVGEVRVGWFERIALKHVYYHMWNRSPVQVQCMRQSAQGWCTGMTLRDGMGREVGGGSGWGTHVHPWLIHVNVWQKPPQYCKVISFQLKLKKKKLSLCLPLIRIHLIAFKANLHYPGKSFHSLILNLITSVKTYIQ